MRSPPVDKYDRDQLKLMKAEPWMVKLLKKNPEYPHWGPHEDYMAKGKDAGWEAPALHKTWIDFGPWGLDELNELVNFYFQISRDSVKCEHCDGSGQNPETNEISRSWYDFEKTGKRWCDSITQDEVDQLVKQKRLWDFTKDGHHPTAEEVNADPRTGARGFAHDAINQWICVETRAKRLGVWGKCKYCKGQGHIYTADHAHVSLVLWFIHPRKGCSRGVEIETITQDELPKVFSYLKEAKKRNSKRFAKVG